MKKRVHPFSLGKETLRHLAAPALDRAGGGGAVAIAPLSQEGTSCIQSCFINTCYDTCQWQAAFGA